MGGERRRLGELGLVQAHIGPAHLQQFVVRARFDDAARLHHEDGVGVADGGEPVGDDEAGAAGAQVGHGVLDEGLGAGVDGRGGLVEDEDRRLGEEGAGDGEELAFAGAEVGAVLVEEVS